MIEKSKLAEAFPIGELLKEEMETRGWTSRTVARLIGGTLREIGVNQLALEMLIAVPEARLDIGFAGDLARAFDVSPELFLNFDRTYREWKGNSRNEHS